MPCRACIRIQLALWNHIMSQKRLTISCPARLACLPMVMTGFYSTSISMSGWFPFWLSFWPQACREWFRGCNSPLCRYPGETDRLATDSTRAAHGHPVCTEDSGSLGIRGCHCMHPSLAACFPRSKGLPGNDRLTLFDTMNLLHDTLKAQSLLNPLWAISTGGSS